MLWCKCAALNSQFSKLSNCLIERSVEHLSFLLVTIQHKHVKQQHFAISILNSISFKMLACDFCFLQQQLPQASKFVILLAIQRCSLIKTIAATLPFGGQSHFVHASFFVLQKSAKVSKALRHMTQSCHAVSGKGNRTGAGSDCAIFHWFEVIRKSGQGQGQELSGTTQNNTNKRRQTPYLLRWSSIL